MKSKIKKIMMILCLFLLTFFAINSRGKYVSDANQNKTVPIAEWNFDKDNEPLKLVVNLAETANHSDVINSTVIAPGSTGQFTLEVKNYTSDTAVEYSIQIDNSEHEYINFTSDDITGRLAIRQSKMVVINWEWPYTDEEEENNIFEFEIPIYIEGKQSIS